MPRRLGEIAGPEFGARSGVNAPLPPRTRKDGVLEEARIGDSEEVLCTTSDPEATAACREAHAPDLNLRLYREHTPSGYARADWIDGRRIAT